MRASATCPVEEHDPLGQTWAGPDLSLQLQGQDWGAAPAGTPADHAVGFESDPRPSVVGENEGVVLGPPQGAGREDPSLAESSRASSETLSDRGSVSSDSAIYDVFRSRRIHVELPPSTLVHPKSQYQGYEPPFPPTRESDAVLSLLKLAQSRGEKGYVEIELESFSFYINSAVYPYEMRPLQHMTTRIGHDQFYFDGVLRLGDTRRYVQGVEVAELPIGNYGTAHATVRGQIWARSRLNSDRDVYYLLTRPSKEYDRFYAPFLWVADLAKHVVDFSAAMLDRGCPVRISSFEAHFMSWLRQTHGKSAEFRRWRAKHPSDDYRTSVAANIDFIWKEINGVLGQKKALSMPLFQETIFFTKYKPTVLPPLPMVVRGEERVAPTIVTPYIEECFGHMAIGRILKAIEYPTARQGISPPARQRLDVSGTGRPQAQALPERLPSSKRTRTSEACFIPLDAIERIKVGDTISTPRDGETTDTRWRNMASKGSAKDDRWFGLVQRVHVAKDGSRSFDVTWFYRPAETPCCVMKYPWPNELFLSDHCTCLEGYRSRVKEHEVLGVHNIDWFGSPDQSGGGEFFVRQTYLVEGRRWVTLQTAHMVCFHGREKLGFKAGDAVLAVVSKSPGARAEPYEVVKVFRQGDRLFVRLRRLLRRGQVGDRRADAAPNELVYTDQLVVAKPDKVIGKCAVRFFRPTEPIPTPYDRGGTGNLFYITHRLVSGHDGVEKCVPLDEGDFPASLRQGFDPARPVPRRLRGMDLFCGSGNFGRGLEEGGAVEMLWANDIWDRAVHTYMANCREPEATKPFLGSVDDLLRRALEGRYADNVPRPGEVEFIAAGSPCPGFSLLTADKTTLAQVKNQSLVASFASFVDLYRPKYGILENVVSIVQARHNRTEDVLSQLFCAIVGMGYQAQLVLGDAWSHGAPQGRSRVFLYFAAAGLQLPDAPLLSHSHHGGVSGRGLGEMCNGEPFVRRSFQPTAFRYVSAAEGTSDLPRIGDGKAEPAVGFPDHRVCTGLTARLRHQIAAIPAHPHGMSFARAWRGGDGVMTAADRALFPAGGARVGPGSHGWGRIRPGDVFPTVTTHSQPTDARVGAGLHWADHRPLTVQEIRRAQGFPDREVLLGTAADRWKLVGNSVARQMALALGLRFREAWARSCAALEGGEAGADDGHRQPGSREVIDLTSARDTPDTSDTNDAAERAGRCRRGSQGVSASITTARKRPLSPRRHAEPEAPSPKIGRFESGESTTPAPPQGTDDADTDDDGGDARAQLADAQPVIPPSPAVAGETPARAAGPTTVRLWTPEELEKDEREPDGNGLHWQFTG
ncbi:hypothetical protein VTH06DRAFT_5557 [Thermothelomyces fergusii]